MPQFTSSTKPLLSFAQTTILENITSKYGDRLSGLTQMEKYQVATSIGLYLWGLAEDIEQPLPDSYPDGEEDTIVDVAIEFLPMGMTSPVNDVLRSLKSEDPNNLAAILSAICEYAKEDERLHT